MGWTVIVENEKREAVAKLRSEFMSPYLGKPNTRGNFILLQYLDPHGDTIFNQIQMNDLIDDLTNLQNEDPNSLLREIILLAKQCREGVHLYLVFYGD